MACRASHVLMTIPAESAAIAYAAAVLVIMTALIAVVVLTPFVIVGVTLVKGYEVERDVKMDVGDTTEVAGYVFTYRGVRDVQGPNYVAAQGLIEVCQREIVLRDPQRLAELAHGGS